MCVNTIGGPDWAEVSPLLANMNKRFELMNHMEEMRTKKSQKRSKKKAFYRARSMNRSLQRHGQCGRAGSEINLFSD